MQVSDVVSSYHTTGAIRPNKNVTTTIEERGAIMVESAVRNQRVH